MPHSRLDAARRLDWRFLLPDPALADVACVTPCDEDLRSALERLAGRVTIGDARELRAAGARPHVVVVAPRGLRDLAEAVGLVPEGGWLYAEFPRRAKVTQLPRRSATFLHARGFGAVRRHWHWPSLAQSTRVSPIDGPSGAGVPLSRHHGSPGRWAQLALMRILGSVGAAELVAGGRSILAYRGDGDPAPWLTLQPWAAAMEKELGAPKPQWVLLTPRFRASSHVLLLMSPPGRPLALVAKVSRLPGEEDGLAREAANLEALERAGVPAGTVPRLVRHEALAGHAVLLEGALRGRHLDPVEIRARPARWIGEAAAWLATLPVSNRRDDRFGELLQEPLERFADAVPGPEGGNAGLVRTTLDQLAVLRDARLPAVLEHGDFSHPNLLVLEDGSLGVLDWELGRADGMPLHDLGFFLAYVAKAVWRVRDARLIPGALNRLLAERRFGAAAALREEAKRLGLDETLLPALLTACWARSTVAAVLRAPDTPQRLGPWLESNRYYLLWRDALQRREELTLALG